MSVQLSPNATCSGTLPQLRRTFLEALAARGESERNIAAHGLGIDRFAEYLAPRPPEDAKPGDLESFLSYLSELGVTAESLKTYRTVVQHWITYVGDHDAEDAVAPAASTPEERLESPMPQASSELTDAADASCSSSVLGGLRPTAIPQAAKKKVEGDAVPVCEVDPTTPMMPAVTPPFIGTAQEPTSAASAMPVVSAAFEPLDPEPTVSAAAAVEAFDPEPSASGAAGFEPLDPEPCASDAAGFEPLDPEPFPSTAAGFEPLDPEPFASTAAGFEPLDPEPPASDAAGFEPLDPDPAAPSAGAFEAIEPEATPSFESFEEPSPPAFAAPMPEPPSSEPSGFASAEPDAADDPAAAGFGAFESDEASVSVPAFGALAESPVDVPMLADENEAAEERGKARLQAPPLPDFDDESAPAPIPGDTEFEGNSASIPLAGGSPTSAPGAGESTVGGPSLAGNSPATLDPTGGEMQTQPGTGKWGMRRAQGERTDLSLDSIITMAIAGELEATDLVRKPSGEWVPAGELRPLRRALGLDGGPSTEVRQVRDDLALGRATAGMVIAGLTSGLLWWFATLAIGVELVPLAILGGLLGGVGARMAARRPALKVGLVGAAAAPMSVLVGRYLVFETVSSGVVLDGLQDVGGFGSFMGSSLGVTQLVCLGLGALAGLLMGSIGGR